MKSLLSLLNLFFIISCVFVEKRSLAEDKINAACSIEKSNCSKDTICMNVDKDKAECRQIPAVAPNEFILPFNSKTEAVCTHAHGVGSHSWPNAFYALDLATPYNNPASIVYAAADGKVFIFFGNHGKPCAEPSGDPATTKTDSCGNGWGNHVKILHKDGYFSFYVHLAKITVKNGQLVKQGDPIGLEGATGLAGHRHLHWSVNKLPGINQSDWEQRISWDGESVPFNFKASLDGVIRIFNSADVQCAHANVGQTISILQPRFKGIK